MKLIARVLAALTFGLLVTPILNAQADDDDNSILWKIVDGWRVAAQPDFGMGCFMEALYEEGMSLRLGLIYGETGRSIYLVIGHPQWGSLEEGKDYDLSFQFYRGGNFDLTASAINNGERRYLASEIYNVEFLRSIERKLGVKIFFGDRLVNAITLKGTSAAMAEVIKCDVAVAETRTNPAPTTPKPDTDPFSPKQETGKTQDPFDL